MGTWGTRRVPGDTAMRGCFPALRLRGYDQFIPEERMRCPASMPRQGAGPANPRALRLAKSATAVVASRAVPPYGRFWPQYRSSKPPARR
jgi:hypothetical protein